MATVARRVNVHEARTQSPKLLVKFRRGTDSLQEPAVIKECIRTPIHKTWVHVLLIVITVLIAYSNTFHVPFVFDDESSIIENRNIRSLGNLLIYGGGGPSYNSRRFIGYLTFALNYHFGGLNVVGYHVVNLAVHIANALLIYVFVRLTFRTPALRDSALVSRSIFLAPATALLFGVHPIQTQAVTYIAQRVTSLATLFYLLSLVAHIRWRLAQETGARFCSKSVLPFYLLSLAAAVLAMRTKEIAFTLPIIVFLYEVFFFGRPDRKRLLSLAPIVLTGAIIPLSMISLQNPVGVTLSDISRVTGGTSTISRCEYLYTQFSVIVTYIRLLALPIGQNLDYDYPINHSLLELRTLLSLLVLVSIMAVAVVLYRRSHRSGDSSLRLAAFGIFWFFITLMVESSIIPIIDVIFEHRLYLPSTGFIIAAAIMGTLAAFKMSKLLQVPEKVTISLLTLVLVGVTVALLLTAYKRNWIWRDDVALWEDTVRKSPGKARPHNNLGYAYMEDGRLDEALGQLQIAVKIEPTYVEAHNNLGIVFTRKGLLEIGVDQLQKAVRIDPDYAEARNSLGIAYAKQGRLDEAIEQFQIAATLSPDFSQAHNNLGTAYFNKGWVEQAIAEYRVAIKLQPDYADAYNNLGITYGKIGLIDQAIKQFQSAIRLQPHNQDFRENLNRAYGLKNRESKFPSF